MLSQVNSPCRRSDAARAKYEKIRASENLPSPTGVALHILQLSQDEDSSIEAIAAAVESDPAIASRLLKLVNSPLAGMSRQIASVSRAVAFLGVRTVTGLALGFSLVSNNRGGICTAFDYDLFWSESLAEGVAAKYLSTQLRNFAPDEAFACGLLCQIGRLALATAFPDAYAEVLSAVSDDDREKLATLEQATFEINHCELAAEMMVDWQMPEIFRSAVRAQQNPDTSNLETGSRPHQLAQMLELAGGIARVLYHSTVYREELSGLIVRANRLGIAPDVYHEVFDSISREWREAGAIFTVRTRRVPPLAEIYDSARQRQIDLELERPLQPNEHISETEEDVRNQR